MKNTTTTVQISKATHKLLQSYCKKSETYDELIQHAVQSYASSLNSKSCFMSSSTSLDNATFSATLTSSTSSNDEKDSKEKK